MVSKIVTSKKVKVRIKLGNTPYLGFVYVPDDMARVSDVLNSTDIYLALNDVSSLEPVNADSLLLVNKREISYIQALEESNAKTPGFDISTIGKFIDVKILLKSLNIKLLGRIFVLFKDDNILFTVNKPSFFLNMKDVVIEGTNEKYSYLAVSKAYIKTIESDGNDVA